MPTAHPRPSRRTALRAACLTVTTALASPLLAPAAARAALPDSGRFELGGAGGNVMWKKPLHANWVMQSFAYDNAGGRVYFVQSKPGDDSGDLWVTATDLAGDERGAMFLRGFGHGVQIGVEPSGGRAYLWTEIKTASNGFGTRIGRFPFQDGVSITSDHASVADLTPRIGGTVRNPQPAIDPYHDRLAVRYSDGGRHHIAVYRLADAKAGATEARLAGRPLPTQAELGLSTRDQPFQGFAVFGRYAYLHYGGPNRDAYIITVDLNTGTAEHRTAVFKTRAGSSLPGREAEGMAIWLVPEGSRIRPRLCYGFHSNTNGVRETSVFYKSEYR